MFALTFNNSTITEQELIEIEQSYKQYLHHKRTIIKVNVLNMSMTELYGYVLNLFIRANVHEILEISVSQLLDFLIDVSNYYTKAPYHTFYHASDTVTMLYYLCHELNASAYLQGLDMACLMVAAICHDMGHPGYNNNFQNNAKTEIAEQYGAQSTLEVYSADLALVILNKHKLNHIHPNKMNECIRDFILYTDMTYHGYLEAEIVQLSSQCYHFNKERRKLLCRILLHAADISNMARPWTISKQWSDLIVEEFFSQGDEERKRNLTISPGMDRDVHTQQTVSIGFGKLITSYFECLAGLLPKSHILLDHLASNRMQWESMAYKRVGPRSHSHPELLYQRHRIHINATIEKTNLLPVLDFRTYSVYDSSNYHDKPIVLIHPYDQ